MIDSIYNMVINQYELFFMTSNGYDVFNSATLTMNADQVDRLRTSIISTFPSHCTNKEISFAMQSLVKHVCSPLRLWLFNLVLTHSKGEVDLIWSFMTHK